MGQIITFHITYLYIVYLRVYSIQDYPLIFVMDADEFRKRAKEMVDYVADYLENIRDRRPLSAVKPGYLRELVPEEAPRDPEPWNDVFRDIERVIMPGVSTLDSFTIRCDYDKLQ